MYDGIKDLRRLIRAGDIKGLSSNFENIGAAGMRKLRRRTTNRCLKRVFRALAELDHNVAKQLGQIKSRRDAQIIVCNILNYKAKLIDWCRK